MCGVCVGVYMYMCVGRVCMECVGVCVEYVGVWVEYVGVHVWQMGQE